MKGLTGIDLFAGAGGMSLGALRAGVQVRLAVELDAYAAKTYTSNHPGTRVFADDVRKISHRVLREALAKAHETVVFGGPPCQGFSYSNSKTRSESNPNNWLFLEYLRIVRLLRPDWTVFENVRGIVNTAEGVFATRVMDELGELGYELSHGVLNAMDFGVPQDRGRFFLVGSRCGVQLPGPYSQRPPTVADAIGDLPELVNGATESWLSYASTPPSDYALSLRRNLTASPNHLVSRNSELVLDRYNYVPPGGNWEDIPARLMTNYADRSRCHTGLYRRLDATKPSCVIGNYRKNMLIHPTLNRGLSVREAARIQSFPDDYEFHGSIGFQQQQVGNAVPPLLAEAIFRTLNTSTTKGGDSP